MNLGRVTRNPAALQILYLDASKESTQAYDSAHIVSLEEGIKDAMENGVWVICLNRLQKPEQSEDSEDEMFSIREDDECQICEEFEGIEVSQQMGLRGRLEYGHNIDFGNFVVKDKKAENQSVPVKNSVCSTCLDEMRSGSWQLQTEDASQLSVQTSTEQTKKLKKRKSNTPASSTNLKKQKVGVPLDHPEFFKLLHALYCTQDAVFRKHIQAYAATLNHGFGVEYHEVDIKEFQKSPFWSLFVEEAGELFSGYFSDKYTPLNHHFCDTLHMLITAMTVAGHLLFLAAQRIETVVTGMGIHALCHGLRCSGFDILANNFLDTASLKLGDKVKMTVSSDSGKITERMSFQSATVIECHLFVRKVNEVDVANEAGIDIESLLGGEHFQLQGRDSRQFFNGSSRIFIHSSAHELVCSHGTVAKQRKVNRVHEENCQTQSQDTTSRWCCERVATEAVRSVRRSTNEQIGAG